MNALRYPVALSAAIAMLAGCGGLQAGTTGVMPPIGAQGKKDSQRFSYTGSEQTFVVPSGVMQLKVEADGAASARPNNRNFRTGRGGGVRAVIPVTPYETLAVVVGGQGSGTSGGFNGGGSGEGDFPGYGGGGASDVRQGGDQLTNRVVVAGGGGGDGGCFYAKGGAGGNDIGGSGKNGYASLGGGGGGGGTQDSGGSGGTGGGYGSGEGDAGGAGQLGSGGNGGEAGPPLSLSYSACGGGGGGGGYYGGGGGGGGGTNNYARYGDGGGGGGGSSYVEGSATKVHMRRHQSKGNGSVVLSW